MSHQTEHDLWPDWRGMCGALGGGSIVPGRGCGGRLVEEEGLRAPTCRDGSQRVLCRLGDGMVPRLGLLL